VSSDSLLGFKAADRPGRAIGAGLGSSSAGVEATGPSSGVPQDKRDEQWRNERVANRQRRGDGQRGNGDEDRGRRDARVRRGISDRKVGLHFDEIASHDGRMDGVEATLELRDVEPTGRRMRREPVCDGIALGVTDAEVECRGHTLEGGAGGHGGVRIGKLKPSLDIKRLDIKATTR